MLATVLIAAVRAYQVLLGPILGRACRFYPSCSQYAIAVIEREGPWRGSRLALGRLMRCTPLQRGGLDLP